jgi:arylsulfatase A-like enzyme
MKIIIVSIDSLRADSLSCYGYKKNTSPSIDKIAGEGILFKYAYTQSNWTYPSYYSLITGLYPSTHKIEKLGQRITSNISTLPQILVKSGFRSFLFSNYYSLLDRKCLGGHFQESDYFEIDKDWDKLQKILSLLKKDNFFMLIHIGNYVHEPYCAPKEFIRDFWEHDFPKRKVIKILTEVSLQFNPKSMRDIIRAINFRKILLSSYEIEFLKACYDAGIKYVDRWIGDFYGFLNSNFKDDVLLIITSDHGQGFFEHGFFGHGLNLNEELIRVPLIFWQKEKKESRKVNSFVQLIDIFPTIGELLELKMPTIDGVSFRECLEGAEQTRWAICERHPLVAYIFNSKKLIISFYRLLPLYERIKDFMERLSKANLRRFLFHLYSFFNTAFYDLNTDKEERKNLARSRKDEVLEMKRFLIDWYKRCKTKSLEITSEEIEDKKIKEQLKALGYM